MSHVDVLQDGVAAVTWEPVVGLVRLVDHVPSDSHPSYIGVGTVTRLSSRVAKLSGFAGEIKRRHMWLICQLLIRQGYEFAYIDRAAGHVMPWGEVIDGGDWSGFWRVDLAEMRGRRKGDNQ